MEKLLNKNPLSYRSGHKIVKKTPTKIINIGNIKVLVRLNTSDEFIAKEVLKNNTYRKLQILPTDIVLDAGLNIGMFTIHTLKHKAFVYAYEPELENYKIAKYNLKINKCYKNYVLYNKAIIGNDDRHRQFAINVKRNKGLHSLIFKRGRINISVECENINNIITTIKPTVIKMDIEGGEYECVKAIKDYSTIREFIIEFHHSALDDIKTKIKYREFIGILQKHFQRVDFREDTKGAWVSIIYCRKQI